LTYPLDGWGNYYGPISSDPAATLAAGLDHVRRTPRDWHFLELGWVDALADRGRTGAALAAAGYPPLCETRDSCAIIDLASFGSWERYLAARSKSRRKDLRKKEKRLAERGQVTYVRHRTTPADGPDADPRLDLYDACVQIARKSWQGNAREGTALCKGRPREFYRDCYLAAVRFGAADLNLILVDGQPAAFDFAYHYRGHVYALKTGYDPEFADTGVGSVLQARGIADSFARGDHTYDLGPEFIEYKSSWMTHQAPILRYTHFPRYALGAQAVRAKRAILGWWRARRAARPAGGPADEAGGRAPNAAGDGASQTEPCEIAS
jgi:CelD/BcsL family acetyltransferase involved in cellulose biosynthesis